MKFHSTNDKSIKCSFREAVLNGIAEDGGLYMPETIPLLPESFFKEISSKSFQEMSFEVARQFVGDEIPSGRLREIIDSAINFPAPVVPLGEGINVLELYHGPTLAFKDFGARFTARIMAHFLENEKKELNILVATSGDTGSAVANGFYNMEGINVILLYPSNKVSKIQEQQLTTLGGNVSALEVEGTFDDCQRLVKQAFSDASLRGKLNLTSANSINFSRLLPQSFYYFNAFRQLSDKTKKLIFSVPSGNLGNLTGGLIAKLMGLRVEKFIAAVNSNDVFAKYIHTGQFNARASVRTLSNAMDVGNPSNIARIFDLYDNKYDVIKSSIYSSSIDDGRTMESIKDVYERYEYVIDPHGAVGYAVLRQYLNENQDDYNSVILETAHPSKFLDIMQDVLDIEIIMPDRLKTCMQKEKRSHLISDAYNDFKEFLIYK